MGEVPRIAKDKSSFNLLPFVLFRKKTLTRAARMAGPFEVETSEGLTRCEDGWLALDSHDSPYPISDAEFQRIYELASPGLYPCNEPVED